MRINETFRALADPTRREILRCLREHDLTAGEIAERFDLARSTLSGHCRVLKSAGLVVSERNRNTVVYSLHTSAFEEAAAAIMDLFGHAGPHGALAADEQSTGGQARNDEE